MAVSTIDAAVLGILHGFKVTDLSIASDCAFFYFVTNF